MGAEVSILIEFEDTSVALMAFQLLMRGPTLPEFGGWKLREDGVFSRLPTASNIQSEIDRASKGWNKQIKSWRPATPEEINLIQINRLFRNAVVKTEDKLDHNIIQARDIYRNYLRKLRSIELPKLDGLWMRAVGQNKIIEADAIEKQRQVWRDAPNNPDINNINHISEFKL